MHLIRCLAFISARLQFSVFTVQVPGVSNQVANALSRDKSLFRHLFLQANPASTPIPLHCWTFWLYRNQIGHQGSGWPCGTLFHHSLAPSTGRSYASAKERYAAYCNKFKFSLLPASEHQLCQFVSFLASESLSHCSINCYLPAISTFIMAYGSTPYVRMTTKKSGGHIKSAQMTCSKCLG